MRVCGSLHLSPSCRHTTPASLSSHWSSHIEPHCPAWKTSTLPSDSERPPTSRTGSVTTAEMHTSINTLILNILHIKNIYKKSKGFYNSIIYNEGNSKPCIGFRTVDGLYSNQILLHSVWTEPCFPYSVVLPCCWVQVTAATRKHSPPFQVVLGHWSKSGSSPWQWTALQWSLAMPGRNRGTVRARPEILEGD